MTLEDIDAAVADWVRGARVAKEGGFSGCQLHGAHGFLLSQFLSPHTNRRTDEYGGSPEKRLNLLKRLVREIREVCPPPYCLSVKLNSADYMAEGGLSQDEGLGQVRWLVECGMVDFVEISGGNAENSTSKLHSPNHLSFHTMISTDRKLRFFRSEVLGESPPNVFIHSNPRSLLHRVCRTRPSPELHRSHSTQWR